MESYQQEEEVPSDDEQHEYVFELNEHDVLCGRGSGPNDRQGNIAFRNLVLTRKAEYLAAPSRDAKGRIANEIVATIRSRGGRFLKKISPTQTKERGYNRNKAIYELADEDTVLEKAKQTLRQNRADFVKEHGLPTEGVGGQGRTMRGTTTVNTNNNNNNTDWGLGGGNLPNLHQLPHTLNNLPCKLNNLPNTLNNLPTTLSNFPQNIMHGASSAQNLMNNNVGGGETSSSNINMNGSNLNPIPLDASSGLDSMQHPKMSANTAAQLNNALFSMSSVTNPSFNSNPQMGCSNSNTQMGINMNMGNTNQMGSSSDYSTLSMNTADLYNAMGMSVNTTTNNSNTSTTSTQAFESLVKEYAIQEEKALAEQFLQQQQQGGGQQQQALPQDMQGQNNIYQQQQRSQQPNMNNGQQQQYLADDQLSSLQGLQNQQQTYNNQPEHQHDNVFASLVQTFAGGDQIQPSQQQQQTALNNNADQSLSDLDAQQQFLLQQFLQIQRMQAQRQTEAQQGQQQQQQARHQEMSVPLNDTQVPLNDAQQFQMGTYTDTSVPLNYQPAKKQPSTNNTNYDKKDSEGSHLDGSSKSNEEAKSADTFKYDPTRRRSSHRRRSTLRRNNASNTTQATNASGTSLGLSNLEPSSLEDESLTMSYKTAQRLARTFNSSSMTMGTSHMTRNSAITNDLDASMLSLMSLSLGGSARSLIDPSLNKHDNSDEKLLTSLKEEGRASPRQPSEVTVEAKKNNDHGESVMSLEPWSPKES